LYLREANVVDGGRDMTLKAGALRIGRVVLGLFFIADGVIKLTGISKTVLLFERIGWGQWFRYFTGATVLVGGAMMLMRLRWTFLGAVLCACTVGTGALLYALKLHRDATVPTALTVVTVALAVLAYSTMRREA
jgi:hypothetical protein